MVRAHGTLSDIPEAGATDHVCWVYEDDAAFDHAVAEFLAGGLQRGERLLCVGERVIESLHGIDLPAQDVAALVAAGAVQTQTLAEACAAAGPFRHGGQQAYYAAATERALAEGYRGLRVIAEVSTLAADPAIRPELVRSEHVADDFIARNGGFTAMCAYSGQLPSEALADVAAVHPVVHTPEGVPPFRIFFDDDRIMLTGSVDTFNADRLAHVLAASPVGPGGAVLDVSLLEFTDVAGCRALALWARRLADRSLPVDVRGASPLFRRMWDILAPGYYGAVVFEESAA
jgi:MEDS: MEthanogen/methylotroph, DcmR Sensory domain/STAS domain